MNNRFIKRGKSLFFHLCKIRQIYLDGVLSALFYLKAFRSDFYFIKWTFLNYPDAVFSNDKFFNFFYIIPSYLIINYYLILIIRPGYLKIETPIGNSNSAKIF